jgi:hypothetical protein
MREAEVPGALKAINGLSFKSTDGVPKPMLTVHGLVQVDKDEVHHIRYEGGRFVVGLPAGPRPRRIYVDASLAPTIGTMAESLKADVIADLRKKQTESLQALEKQAEAYGNDIEFTSVQLRRSVAQLVAREMRARNNAAGAMIIDAMNQINEERKELAEEWNDQVTVWARIVERDVKEGSFDLDASEQALRKAGNDLIAGKTVETPRLVTDGVPDSQSANNLIRTAWDRIQEPSERLRDLANNAAARTPRPDQAQFKKLEQHLISIVDATIQSKPLPSIGDSGLREVLREQFDFAEDEAMEFASSLNSLTERVSQLAKLRTAIGSAPKVGENVQVKYEVGDRIYFDEAQDVQVIIDNAANNVKGFIFSPALSNRLFGAAEMSPADFLGKFCEAYDIPAVSALIDAVGDEAMAEAGYQTMELEDALRGGKLRKYEDHEAGYRLLLRGKMIMFERIPRIADSKLGQ